MIFAYFFNLFEHIIFLSQHAMAMKFSALSTQLWCRSKIFCEKWPLEWQGVVYACMPGYCRPGHIKQKIWESTIITNHVDCHRQSVHGAVLNYWTHYLQYMWLSARKGIFHKFGLIKVIMALEQNTSQVNIIWLMNR